MSESQSPKLAIGLLWAGFLVVLIAVFVRALVAFDPLPHWSTDPLIVNAPSVEAGPAVSLLLDVLSFGGLAAILFAAGLARRRVPIVLLGLLGVGLCAAAWHAGASGLRDLDNTRLGFNWAAALASAIAAFVACQDERLRRLAVASLLGLSFMLVTRGVLQYFIEHFDTLAAFEQTKDAFFRSKGWAEDSAMAKSYVRRLSQPEATGWFGLSNVYATLQAASTVALIGFAACAVRTRMKGDEELTGGWVGLLCTGAVAAAAGLVLSGSRAGMLALAAGLGTLALTWIVQCKFASDNPIRLRSAGGALVIAIAVAAIALIAIQPVLGDRALDLSLRFRGFYMWGASQIALDHPLAGVGPGNFQDAYMLAKPAGAPENVASPHSIAFDLLACYGLLGAAWLVIWATLAFRAGKSLFSQPTTDGALATWRQRRIDFILLLGITAIPTLASAWFEAAATTPDRVIARMVGLVGWLGIAAACVTFMRRVPLWSAGAAAAGVALVVHAQLDVAPVTFGSAPWIATFLGAVAANQWGGKAPSEHEDEANGRSTRQGIYSSVAVAAVTLAIAIGAWIPTARFENHLTSAASALEPLTNTRARLDAIDARSFAAQGDSMAQVTADLSTMLAIAPPRTQREFNEAMDQLFLVTSNSASQHLVWAAESYPANVPIESARARLSLNRAEVLALTAGLTPAVIAEIDAAMAIGTALTNDRPETPGAWAALGSEAWRASRIDPDRENTLVEQAITAWTEAAALDPHGVIFPVRLHDAYMKSGNLAQAKSWADRAITADQALSLDPLVGLTDTDRTRLKQTLSIP